MTEADYMDACQQTGRWDEDNRQTLTHEVVDYRNERIFAGSRAACWAYRRRYGGFVRAALEGEK